VRRRAGGEDGDGDILRERCSRVSVRYQSRVAYCCDIMHHYGGSLVARDAVLRFHRAGGGERGRGGAREGNGPSGTRIKGQISRSPWTALG